MQSLSLGFHTKSRAGDLLIRVISDVGMMRDVAVTALMPMLANVLILAGMLSMMFWLRWELALAALAGRDFLLCLLGLTAISLAYNIAPLRLKERPGLDIAANGASLGFLLPLAGWSLSQPLGEFPRLYFASVVCYLVAFYCPTMAVDVVADRAVGTTTFATRFGAVATMRLS